MMGKIKFCYLLLVIVSLTFCNKQNSTDNEIPIRLHPDNPHYFKYRGKPLLLATSAEHYGALINLDFDFVPYFKALHKNGLNATRIFSGTMIERGKDIKWMGYNNTLAPRPGRLVVPWARSSINGYFGGGNKFDLDRWDETYFKRLKDILTFANERGIVVELTLFGNQYSDSLWMNSPLYPKNNVQCEGPSGAGSFLLFQTLKDKNLLKRQEAFVNKVVHELNSFDNLYYEICNEPYNEVTDTTAVNEWHKHIIALIKQVELNLPKKHLIASNQAVVDNPNVSVANYHYIKIPGKPSDEWLYSLNKVISMDETQGSLFDSDVSDVRVEAWDFILRGGGAYNNLCWEYTPDRESGTDSSLLIGQQLNKIQKFMSNVDYPNMGPDNTSVIKIQDGACLRLLSEKGRQYAGYLYHGKAKADKEGNIWGFDASEGSFQDSVSINIPKGNYSLNFFIPASGTLNAQSQLESKGENLTILTPAFYTDIAFFIKRK